MHQVQVGVVGFNLIDKQTGRARVWIVQVHVVFGSALGCYVEICTKLLVFYNMSMIS